LHFLFYSFLLFIVAVQLDEAHEAASQPSQEPGNKALQQVPELVVAAPTARATTSKITAYMNKRVTSTVVQKADEQIVRMVTKEFQPFSIVEDQEFKTQKTASHIEPGLQVAIEKYSQRLPHPEILQPVLGTSPNNRVVVRGVLGAGRR